jgi:GTP-binding protein
MSKPIVAIIGRQNVGKSTLLNRLAGKRLAIVADLPGTTRDRIFADVSWEGTSFTLVDTGGLELSPRSKVAQGVRAQVEAAIAEADLIIFLVDAKDGVVASDLEIAQMLRRSSKPLVLAANKADNPALESAAVEFYQLGLGEPLAISAYHGRGTAELLDKVISLLPAPKAVESKAEIMKLAIVGRPNVGKSTLLNAILGEERAIVDETPGTTHDAVDTRLDFGGQDVILIDTAGIRRRGRWGVGVERYSIIRALRAIDEADDKYIRRQFKFLSYAPVFYISAKFGQGVDKILPEAFGVYQERLKRPAAGLINDVVREAVASHVLPRKGTKQLKVFSATQAEASPPTFVFLVNDTKLIHFSYQRYLENKLRQAFGFGGTPLRLIFKTGGEPS